MQDCKWWRMVISSPTHATYVVYFLGFDIFYCCQFKNDYIYYAENSRIYLLNILKVDRACVCGGIVLRCLRDIVTFIVVS